MTQINFALLEKILSAAPGVPDPADPNVFRNGTPIMVLAGPRPWMIETWLRDCDTANKLDWHFSGGRAQVLSLKPEKHLQHLRATVATLAEACVRSPEAGSYPLVYTILGDEGFGPRYRAGVDAVPPGTLVVD